MTDCDVWEQKLKALLDTLTSDEQCVALQDFVNTTICMHQAEKGALLAKTLPFVAAVDDALKTVVVAATCDRIEHLRFIVDLVARILSREPAAYEAMKRAVARDELEWLCGEPLPNAVLPLLLAPVAQNAMVAQVLPEKLFVAECGDSDASLSDMAECSSSETN